MQQEKIHVTGPFELDYKKATNELVLQCVEPSGRAVEIRFNPHAARGLCELLGRAIQMNQGMLGTPGKPVQRH